LSSAYTELALTALAAMVSPTTLSFSVFALVLGERPLRTGLWFFIGAFGATLLIGVLAAFVLGSAAAPSHSSEQPPTAVAILDLVFGVLLLGWVVRALRRPADPRRITATVEKMSAVASSPAVAVVAAGATLANPGGFIPIALKSISQADPSTAEFIVVWAAFGLVALLPLLLSLIALAVAPGRAKAVLAQARLWLERHARTLAAVILVLLAAALIRNGVVALTA
jgi:Sap, sulfolipid-1-addressing protein